ncbi:MAG: diaminopimelate decarboxylase [Acidobacteria bacterium RIFCSPLOWO2_12_FULL_67_14]|nr:MAG: diaminopimelate decarboxylase [Acidobacteria bacterium RIFCSPLOWO2_02_FULL_67_21]OFW38117.1 MAG: diaminopimelate decarboxylase [Acidobacteria bacterium RIFCSPLOWO2_12_FULL_67_14]
MRAPVSESFTHTQNALACDGVSIESIVERVGTPVYVYSARAVRDAFREMDAAFAACPHAIHYGMKANSTLALVRLLHSIGSKVDANSRGEIEVALRAGYRPRDIVFTGVGKTRDELEHAIAADIGVINAESAGELDRIDALASGQGREARVALRVNPDIDACSHPNISTGLRINKFGVPLPQARAIYRERRSQKSLRFVGVHVHIGSQITTADPLRHAAAAAATLASELQSDGVALEHVDIGGGLGIPYEGRPMIGAADYAAAVIPELRRTGLPVLLEPGRAIVGRAGALVARVVDTKRYTGGRQFAVLDAGMAELMRPALYGSFHRIVPVRPPRGAETSWDVVGPICESSDVFARDRLLPPLEVDDLVAILDAGAYGSAMASNYNRHLLPAEVLVDQGRWALIRRRQTIDDMLALES